MLVVLSYCIQQQCKPAVLHVPPFWVAKQHPWFLWPGFSNFAISRAASKVFKLMTSSVGESCYCACCTDSAEGTLKHWQIAHKAASSSALCRLLM